MDQPSTQPEELSSSTSAETEGDEPSMSPSASSSLSSSSTTFPTSSVANTTQPLRVALNSNQAGGADTQRSNGSVVLPLGMVSSMSQERSSDKEHYERTFPPRVVFWAGVVDAVVGVLAITTHIVLMTNGSADKASFTSIQSCSGVWAGVAAAVAACLCWLSAARPTRCSVPAALVASLTSAALGLAMVVLATRGLIAVRQDADSDDDDGMPHMIGVRFHPAGLSRVFFKPVADDDKAERAKRQAVAQMICFGLQVLLGVLQVLCGVGVFSLACRAWRCQWPPAPLASSHAHLTQPVLFAARSEAHQRDGFITIQFPSVMFANAERDAAEAHQRDGAAAAAGTDAAGAAAVQHRDDPPPKYDEMAFHPGL